MAWIRYLLYFFLITLIMATLTRLEIAYPGSLRLQVFTGATDALGTSKFSPLEMIQPRIADGLGGHELCVTAACSIRVRRSRARIYDS